MSEASWFLRWLFDRFARYLFYRREPVLDFTEAALAQGEHPLLNGLAPQLQAGCPDEHQLAQLVGDVHHLVETDATLVAGVVALVAALALHRHDVFGHFC